MIGYGAWGRYHAEAIGKAPGAELAAIACASEATAAAARERHPNAKLHLDWRQLLADRSIDAVDIVVPNHLHADIAIAALEAGKNVLLEKPMAASIADCDRLVEAVRRTGKVLSVGHEFRASTQWGTRTTPVCCARCPLWQVRRLPNGSRYTCDTSPAPQAARFGQRWSSMLRI
jgi:myo-inositol 2-dehydrogenase/D-chiro-inositol 1-dehydrogenase